MIKNASKYIFLPVLFFLLMFSFGQTACAKSVVSDTAKILTGEESEELLEYCNTIDRLYDTSIYIVTSDTIGMNDDFTGYMERIGSAEDAPENLVLLFVSVKENGHVYQIFGYGKAEHFMDNSRCNKVMDLMQNDLSNAEYFNALKTFCEEVQRYMGKDPRFDSFLYHPLFHLAAALLLSIIIIFCMVRNSTGRNTTTVSTYIDKNHSRLLGRIDHFTHMTVKRVKISDSSSGGGHSGGGGGSRSHSSGNARSF